MRLASTLVFTLTVPVPLTVPPGPVAREVVGGGGVRRDSLVAAGRHRADAADIGVDGFGGLPIQR